MRQKTIKAKRKGLVLFYKNVDRAVDLNVKVHGIYVSPVQVLTKEFTPTRRMIARLVSMNRLPKCAQRGG